MENNEIRNNYYASIHKIGRSSNLIAVAMMIVIPIVMTIAYHLNLEMSSLISGCIQLCIVFVPTQLIEVLNYSAVLGSGGTYLAFVTGNVSGMKLPAAASGQRLAGVEPFSDEGEVVAVLSVGVSSLTTMLIIILGMFALTPIIPYLSDPVLSPGFNNIMPALMGGMLAPYFFNKDRVVTIVPVAVALAVGAIFTSSQLSSYQGYIMLTTMVLSVLYVLGLYKTGLLGREKAVEKK